MLSHHLFCIDVLVTAWHCSVWLVCAHLAIVDCLHVCSRRVRAASRHLLSSKWVPRPMLAAVLREVLLCTLQRSLCPKGRRVCCKSSSGAASCPGPTPPLTALRGANPSRCSSRCASAAVALERASPCLVEMANSVTGPSDRASVLQVGFSFDRRAPKLVKVLPGPPTHVALLACPACIANGVTALPDKEDPSGGPFLLSLRDCSGLSATLAAPHVVSGQTASAILRDSSNYVPLRLPLCRIALPNGTTVLDSTTEAVAESWDIDFGSGVLKLTAPLNSVTLTPDEWSTAGGKLALVIQTVLLQATRERKKQNQTALKWGAVDGLPGGLQEIGKALLVPSAAPAAVKVLMDSATGTATCSEDPTKAHSWRVVCDAGSAIHGANLRTALSLSL